MRIWIAVAAGGVVSAIAFGAVLYAVTDGSAQRGEQTSILVLDRPEVRWAACPTAATMAPSGPYLSNNRRDMTVGPVTMHFAALGLDLDNRVRTGHFDDGLKQKIPLHILAPVGTTFAISGSHHLSGAAMIWDGPTQLSDRVPVAEQTFVPGQMIFPEPGCYQVFVDVEGARYGPFGFVVLDGG